MLVYTADKTKFLYHVRENIIADEILDAYEHIFGHRVGSSEVRSWQNSMQFMKTIIEDPEIPSDVGISIEYRLPLTSNRVDFIITGTDEQDRESVILIELKQWDKAELTNQDGIVRTYVGKMGNQTHPSYQAWSYAQTLENYSQTVQDDNIQLKPCAYLHNYPDDDVIKNDFYAKYLEVAPAFLKRDREKLQTFIKQFVKRGDTKNTMYRIENGKIKPSKALADSIASMMKGNREFVMIDDQKVVYEEGLSLAAKVNSEDKHVLIVQGGPGTGKSVVAINLLAKLVSEQILVKYVTRNGAPRAVYKSRLVGHMGRSTIDDLFANPWSFVECEANTFEVLLIDEAHRLNEKSGLYGNLGENQVKELISAAHLSIFFLDEDQRVTLKDIGTKAEIYKWSNAAGASVSELELASQFRCNGSDGFLSWLDDSLQIRETANTELTDIDYDFQVIESPTDLIEIIKKKNSNNKARLVAGYCWPWLSQKDNTGSVKDIVIGPDFAMRWNLTEDGPLWIQKPNSVNEVGCIHTCQGLEVDYIGVIIGDDMIVRDGQIITDATKRAPQDKSVRGYKTLAKADPDGARELADMIIKNTYKTLMTRGQKGCYIYCTDPETQDYFRELASRPAVLK